MDGLTAPSVPSFSCSPLSSDNPPADDGLMADTDSMGCLATKPFTIEPDH